MRPPSPPCCGLASRLSPDALASLDAALRSGTPYRTAAANAGLPPSAESAVFKHRSHLLTAAGDPVGKRPEEQAEATGKQGEAKTLLESSRALRRRVSKMLRRVEAGETDIDFKAGAALAAQFKNVLELEAKLLGEIKAASTTVNIVQSPDWQEVRALLIEALVPFPDAAAAVLDVFARREAKAATLN